MHDFFSSAITRLPPDDSTRVEPHRLLGKPNSLFAVVVHRERNQTRNRYTFVLATSEMKARTREYNTPSQETRGRG